MFDDIIVQAFFVEDDIGLDGTAAGIAFGDACRLVDLLGIKEFMAVLAEIAVDTAVQFQDVFTTAFLMETVDILSNDGFQLARLFQFSQLFVGHIRLGRKGRVQDFVPVEPVKFIGVLFIKRVGQHRFRRIFVMLVIQPVFTAEIRDAAFCGNAGTTEKYNIV